MKVLGLQSSKIGAYNNINNGSNQPSFGNINMNSVKSEGVRALKSAEYKLNPFGSYDRLFLLPENKEKTFVFISDIDGTWKSPLPELAEHARKLDKAVRKIVVRCREVGVDLFVGKASARPDERILQANLLPDDLTLADNGAAIVRGLPSKERFGMPAWTKVLDESGFSSNKLLGFVGELLTDSRFEGLGVETVGKVVKNPAADACKYISSLCIQNESIKLNSALGETAEIFDKAHYKTPSQVTEFMDALALKMKETGINYKLSPAYLFAGKPYVMFDVAAPNANKGDAVNYLTKGLIKPKNLIVAGDGGNDIIMMDNDGRNVIVVGNDKQLKASVANLTKDFVVIEDNPEKPCSMALLDGLVTVLKEKCHQLYQKGLIHREPDLENLLSEPRRQTSEEAWREYFEAS